MRPETRRLIRARTVIVNGHADDNTLDVERYKGRIGRIVGYTVAGDGADVGDTPDDPAFRVRFPPSGGRPAVSDLFWTDELSPYVRTP
jgi:hypothetical protein